LRYLGSASHRFDATSETKRAVAEVVADVKPDVAFLMWPHNHHHDHAVASVLSNLALRHGDRVWDRGAVPVPQRIYAYDNGPRHTIGFEPNTFVDVTAEWPAAADWLGQFMALTRGQPYGRAKSDGAVRAKEALDRYRSTPSRYVAHRPRATAVPMRTRCVSMRLIVLATGPEPATQGSSAGRASARWVLRLAQACRCDRSAQLSHKPLSSARCPKPRVSDVPDAQGRPPHPGTPPR
jgi:hypothetical protein